MLSAVQDQTFPWPEGPASTAPNNRHCWRPSGYWHRVWMRALSWLTPNQNLPELVSKVRSTKLGMQRLRLRAARFCCPFWTMRDVSSILDGANLFWTTRAYCLFFDRAKRVSGFEDQIDSAIKRGRCRAERGVTNDVLTTVLRDTSVLHQVAQLSQYSRSWHADCARDLLGCKGLTTQRSGP